MNISTHRKWAILSGFPWAIMFAVAWAVQAPAATVIEIDPSTQTVGTGVQVTVEVNISGLVDAAAPSLGTFDLDIGYNPAVLTYVGTTFGDPVFGDQLDLASFGSIQSATNSAGTLNVFELSVDSATDLDVLQRADFTLLRVLFQTASQGTSQLTLFANALGDDSGSPLTATLTNGSITVVPEPGAPMLLLTGAAAIAFRRRKRVPAVRMLTLIAINVLIAGMGSRNTYASVFYSYEVAAQSGQAGLSSIKPDVSINDSGRVAFIGGGVVNSNSIWIGDIGGAARSINSGFIGTSRDFANPQVNNSGVVVARDRVTGSPASFLIRVWNPTGTWTTVASEILSFSSVLLPTISNDGNVSYVRLPDTAQPMTELGLNGALLPGASFPGTLSLRPRVSDGGKVVIRAGNNSSDPIRLYFPGGPEVIAPGFTVYGQSPGISDDGVVVGLAGTGPGGPGIFISVKEDAGARRVIRVSGMVGELGQDAAGAANGFASYLTDSRVGVTHQSLGNAGLGDDCIAVSFIGTPREASPEGLFAKQQGLWVVRYKITESAGVYTYASTGVVPVAQVGDTNIVPGAAITAISVSDPIALAANNKTGTPRVSRFGEHRVAFLATTAAGQAVVRATYFDEDEDALPDHWEQNGLTVDGQFIDLPTMGANPLRKDLFVHADWKDVGGGASQYKPSNTAMKAVVDAFFSGDTPNPVGPTGITLHVDSGPNSWMKPGVTWGALSKAGAVAVPSPVAVWNDVLAAQTVRFNPAKRGAVFRYCLFADSYDLYPTSSGIAQTPGNLFVVTLGLTGGTTPETTGTFMHEMGHTLGLLHGGADDDNYKPNYISVMNYLFQFSGLYTTAHRNGLVWNYCKNALPDLDETNLFEATGIGDPTFLTKWFYPDPLTGVPRLLTNAVSTPPTDWNGDGAATAGRLMIDINADGSPDGMGGWLPSLTMLTGGLNEWRNLVLDGGGHIGAARGASQTPEELQPIASVIEATVAELRAAVSQEVRDAQAQAPVDEVTYSPALGYAPLTVSFDGSASTAPLGAVVAWAWSFDDGGVGAGATTTHSYVTPRIYKARLTVTDNLGNVNLSPSLQVVEVRTLGDIDGDADVDRDDLAILLKARNTPAAGPNDLLDLNRDGKIDALDSRILATKFTRPGGATQ